MADSDEQIHEATEQKLAKARKRPCATSQKVAGCS